MQGVNLYQKTDKGKFLVLKTDKDITLMAFSHSKNTFFLYEKGTDFVLNLDKNGFLNVWKKSKDFKNLVGLACSNNCLFALNDKCEILGVDIFSKTKYDVVGTRASSQLSKKIGGKFCTDSSNLFYDPFRDFLFVKVPRRRKFATIDGMGHIYWEFGDGEKEFTIGSDSMNCGFSNPFSISSLKTGFVAISDKDSHAVFLFKEKKNHHHEVCKVIGNPIRCGWKAGKLEDALLNNPSFLYGHKKYIFVVDNEKWIRKIDLEKMTIEPEAETNAKITNLFCNANNEVYWTERALTH